MKKKKIHARASKDCGHYASEKIYSVRLDNDLIEKFKKKLNEQGKSAKFVMTQLLSEWIYWK